MQTDTQQEAIQKNIVLIGFMGCGKSSVGRAISQQLNYPIIDTDCSIAKAAGMTIPQIFETQGESHFREMETESLQKIQQDTIQHHIISTGGGMPVTAINRQLLPQLGFVVWLRARADTILERTQHSKHRPLLNNTDKLNTITNLLDQRTAYYEDIAQLKVSTDDMSIDDITHGIIESARYFFSNS